MRIQVPRLISLHVGSSSTLHGYLILASDGLSIENKEGHDAILLPLVEVLVDVRTDSRQTTKGGKKRLVGGVVVEELAKVVGSIDGNGAVLEL